MDNYFLGVDIGTGSTKAVALSVSGKVLHVANVSYPSLLPAPHRHEQAPELIWQAFVKCISRVNTALGTRPTAIVLSSAMHSLLAVDQRGQPLMNMITWADGRSSAIAQHLHASPEGKDCYEKTGTPIHAMSPLCKLMWLKENESGLFDKTHKFISIKEYIWFRLFGTYEVDYSIASATGLFDIQKLEWYSPALKLAGITEDRLSQPVNTTYERSGLSPTIQPLLQLGRDTIFIIGASDGCLAHIGSHALADDIASLTIGSSGAVRVSGMQPSINFSSMTFNYRLDENIFISGGPINNGGLVLKWFLEEVLTGKSLTTAEIGVLEKQAGMIPPGSNGLLFLPYVLGERAPIWNSNATGVFFGMNGNHKQANFVRAVLEGISFALYSVAQGIRDFDSRIERVHVSGGASHASVWMQLLADIFNKVMCVSAIEDASALGAITLGMKHLGFVDTYQSEFPSDGRLFTPNVGNHHVYQPLLSRFKILYEKLKDEMKE